VLFATETFSTGLNMPARTVAFAGVRKFDGACFRNLSGGEYTQMSGRAGRRGLDATGTVILLCDQKLEPSAAKDIVRGRPDPLRSAFRLTYSSLLAVLRLDSAQVTPEMLIGRSFRQWQAARALPALRARRAAADAAADAAVVDDEAEASEVLALLEERGAVAAAVRAIEAQPQHAVPFLQPGRLVRLAVAAPPAPRHLVDVVDVQTLAGDGDADTTGDAQEAVPTGDVEGVWAAVLSFERVKAGAAAATSAQKKNGNVTADVAKDVNEALSAAYVVDVLACAAADATALGGRAAARRLLSHDDPAGVPLVVAVPLSQLVGLGAPRVVLPKEILTQEARRAFLSATQLPELASYAARACDGWGLG
jgi:ATP-dependent RNA helicase DOB1